MNGSCAYVEQQPNLQERLTILYRNSCFSAAHTASTLSGLRHLLNGQICVFSILSVGPAVNRWLKRKEVKSWPRGDDLFVG